MAEIDSKPAGLITPPAHFHCPDGCEKPQPREVDGVLVCVRCLVKYEEVVPMIPCTPEICGE